MHVGDGLWTSRGIEEMPFYKAGRCPTRRETARWISLRASWASPPTPPLLRAWTCLRQGALCTPACGRVSVNALRHCHLSRGERQECANADAAKIPEMRACAGQGAISKGFARCAKRMPRLPQKQPRDSREAASGVGAARVNKLDEIAPTSPSTCARFLLLFLKKKPPPGQGGKKKK